MHWQVSACACVQAAAIDAPQTLPWAGQYHRAWSPLHTPRTATHAVFAHISCPGRRSRAHASHWLSTLLSSSSNSSKEIQIRAVSKRVLWTRESCGKEEETYRLIQSLLHEVQLQVHLCTVLCALCIGKLHKQKSQHSVPCTNRFEGLRLVTPSVLE